MSRPSPPRQGSTPSTGRPVRPVSIRSPGASRPGSPRNLLMTNPLIRAWSAGCSKASVPYRAANTPPRSMSPTTTTGSPAARASPMLAMSVSRRLISAGLPAPSQMTTSYSALRSSRLSRAILSRSPECVRYSAALTSSRGWPSTMTWVRVSLPGLSSTGFIRASGSMPAAVACMAWARPISAPSGVTKELRDMFWALNGATRTPCLASQRHSPAVSTLFPASEVVPATSRPPFTGGSLVRGGG